MAGLRELLNDRLGDRTVSEMAAEINSLIPEQDSRVGVPTLYSYLNGTRNIGGKGAKALAIYFYQKNDMEVVSAISEVTLGVPYAPEVGAC